MTRPEQDPSVFSEPHQRPGGFRPDPTEETASRASGGASPERAAEDAALHSVHDEPAMLPDARPRLIEQDWSCSNCGYNLRGLQTGGRCPECGHVEVYHPAPAGAPRYATWLAQKRAATTAASSWTAVALAAAVAGLFGILGTLFKGPFLGATGPMLPFLPMVLFAPLIEEVMKIAAAAYLVERKPFLLRTPGQILFVGVAGGFGFATIENVLYLAVYISNPTMTTVLWRLIVCTALHVCCSWVAAQGLANVWRRTISEGRPPRMGLAVRPLITAIMIHAGYNAGVLVWGSRFWY